MKTKSITGHIAAAVTILIWGTTFISTKILLKSFSPAEILFFRFVIGFLILSAAYPKFMKAANMKHECLFAAAGLSGICLYYLLENIALTYTSAANAGVIISTAPLFTAILSVLSDKQQKELHFRFFTGFAAAMAGISLISFGEKAISSNAAGDLLAAAAALIWSFYSILTRKIGDLGYNTIQATRRTFLYGILFMLPFLFIFDFHTDFTGLLTAKNIFNLLFLGIGASALCFVTWNYAVKRLGAVKTSAYIYMVPLITVCASAIVLKESITPAIVTGMLLTLAGLFISESKFSSKRRKENGNTK